MRAYSTDLRERVLADCDAGTLPAAVAAKYRVSPSWVRRLKQRRRDHRRSAPRPAGRRRPAPGRPHADAIPGGRRRGPGRHPGRVSAAARPGRQPRHPVPRRRRGSA